MPRNFEEVLDLAKKKNNSKKICVAIAQDDDVLKSVSLANEKGIATAILVGDREKILRIAEDEKIDLSSAEIVDEKDYDKAAQVSVNIVREKRADILCKGKIQTPDMMKAVLNKETGLRSSDLLSHVGLLETKCYHKLLFITDGGININPDLQKKISIVKNAVKVARAMNISCPKVAGIGAIELVNPDMPVTIDYSILSMMNKRGQLKDCTFEGPFGLDNAISKDAAIAKGIQSDIAGDADILLVPNIETGNVLLKSCAYLMGAYWAGIVAGARCPIVLGSRADSYETKLYSIATAVAMAD